LIPGVIVVSRAVSIIVTGGQTGVDRAALDVAREFDIECAGWCPKGRIAEDGPIDQRYPLTETDSADVAQRTEWNARDSDATLVLTCGKPTDGTPLTVTMARKYGKPCLILDLEQPIIKEIFVDWLHKHNVSRLNIAGPRESHRPGFVYSAACQALRLLLSTRQ